jgi:hypothetical protein
MIFDWVVKDCFAEIITTTVRSIDAMRPSRSMDDWRIHLAALTPGENPIFLSKLIN